MEETEKTLRDEVSFFCDFFAICLIHPVPLLLFPDSRE